MELSERFIQQLEKEGFSTVSEWQDEAGVVYPEHSHEEKIAFYVTDGSVTVEMRGVEKIINVGERIDVPPNVPHSVVVGNEGCIVIIGES